MDHLGGQKRTYLVALLVDGPKYSGVRMNAPVGMIDSFGRRITYVRMSVTDRCDLRCRYCMAERMVFLPKQEILTLEEIVALSDIFVARGVNRIRLTGGEPLVRRGIMNLVRKLGERVGHGLSRICAVVARGGAAR